MRLLAVLVLALAIASPVAAHEDWDVPPPLTEWEAYYNVFDESTYKVPVAEAEWWARMLYGRMMATLYPGHTPNFHEPIELTFDRPYSGGEASPGWGLIRLYPKPMIHVSLIAHEVVHLRPGLSGRDAAIPVPGSFPESVKESSPCGLVLSHRAYILV